MAEELNSTEVIASQFPLIGECLDFPARVTLDQYQEATGETALYYVPERVMTLQNPTGDPQRHIRDKLTEEVLEVLFSKPVFQEVLVWEAEPTPEAIHEIKTELGDALWYTARLAKDNGLNLSSVADALIRKYIQPGRQTVIQDSSVSADTLLNSDNSAMTLDTFQQFSVSQPQIGDRIDKRGISIPAVFNPITAGIRMVRELDVAFGENDHLRFHSVPVDEYPIDIAIGHLAWLVGIVGDQTLGVNLSEIARHNLQKNASRSIKGATFNIQIR